MVGTGREVELVHGGAHQHAAGFVQRGKLSHFYRAHIGIAREGRHIRWVRILASFRRSWMVITHVEALSLYFPGSFLWGSGNPIIQSIPVSERYTAHPQKLGQSFISHGGSPPCS